MRETLYFIDAIIASQEAPVKNVLGQIYDFFIFDKGMCPFLMFLTNRNVS